MQELCSRRSLEAQTEFLCSSFFFFFSADSEKKKSAESDESESAEKYGRERISARSDSRTTSPLQCRLFSA